MQFSARHIHRIAASYLSSLLCLWLLTASAQTTPLGPEAADTARLEDERILLFEPPSTHTIEAEFRERTATIVVGVPFCGIAVLESTLILESRSPKPFVKTTRLRRCRDGVGRMREEQLLDGREPNQYDEIKITDPVTESRHVLRVKDGSLVAVSYVEPKRVQPPFDPPAPIEGSLRRFLTEFGGDAIRAPGRMTSRTVPLGRKIVQGVRAVGTRLEYRVPGKGRPIRIDSEQWFSRELGLVIESRMNVAVSSELGLATTYRLQVELGEPDAALFAVPP